jgi:hypothetical protein
MKLVITNSPFARIEGVFYFMTTENYDYLEWEIGYLPIGSSTPDDLFELSYDATSHCPMCNSKINGTAYYWSTSEDMTDMWLHTIDYEDCDCGESEEELEDYLTQ